MRLAGRFPSFTVEWTAHMQYKNKKNPGPRPWYRWRLVTLAEVAGYAMTIAVIVVLVYTLFVEVEMTIEGTGLLEPALAAIETQEPTLLVSFLASDGEWVAFDAPVCAVFVEPAAQRRYLAQEHLRLALKNIEADSQSSNDTLKALRIALDAGPDPGEPTIIRAPQKGWIHCEPGIGQFEILSAGRTLAQFYNFNRLMLEFLTRPDGKEGPKASVGNLVRVRWAALSKPLLGKVTKTEDIDSQRQKITAIFHPVDQEARDSLYTLIFDGIGQEFPTVEGVVIVGHRSLFRALFGRR